MVDKKLSFPHPAVYTSLFTVSFSDEEILNNSSIRAAATTDNNVCARWLGVTQLLHVHSVNDYIFGSAARLHSFPAFAVVFLAIRGAGSVTHKTHVLPPIKSNQRIRHDTFTV